MTRIVYVNGRYLPYGQAAVHVEDRGFQFADSVYEVCEVKNGALIDEERHAARLQRSLKELGIPSPATSWTIGHIMRQCIARNRVRNGVVYLQVTRGEAARDFAFPSDDVAPTFVCLARSTNQAKTEALAAAGIAVKTLPEIRWGRCDIKTVMLLPACLAKEAARAAGAREAWFVDEEGFITEGASSNAWIVDAEGKLITRTLGRELLPGVTRATLLDLIARDSLAVEERAFTVAEAYQAREAFTTSASATVMPVVKIDDRLIGDGKPGAFTMRLRSSFHQVAKVSGR
jgi:D-alanine transaminase